jgi:hypothetical protein
MLATLTTKEAGVVAGTRVVERAPEVMALEATEVMAAAR